MWNFLKIEWTKYMKCWEKKGSFMFVHHYKVLGPRRLIQLYHSRPKILKIKNFVSCQELNGRKKAKQSYISHDSFSVSALLLVKWSHARHWPEEYKQQKWTGSVLSKWFEVKIWYFLWINNYGWWLKEGSAICGKS